MGTTASEKSTWWLIQNAAITAISPSRDASQETDNEPGWLSAFQKRLKSSRSKMLGDDTLLSPPRWHLTIQFDDGSHRTIAFGYHPPKLISACRISIDGTERVVMSPGLPEYDAITSRCQPFEPSSYQNHTASGWSMIGILLSLLTYLAYVIIT